jgi:hypothetical protein
MAKKRGGGLLGKLFGAGARSTGPSTDRSTVPYPGAAAGIGAGGTGARWDDSEHVPTKGRGRRTRPARRDRESSDDSAFEAVLDEISVSPSEGRPGGPADRDGTGLYNLDDVASG